MTLSNVIIDRRKVKHARLRVAETGEVRLIIPMHLEDGQVAELLTRKASWIAEKQAFLTRHTQERITPCDLAPHSLLLHGEPYHISFDSRLGNRTRVIHTGKVIESGLRLEDERIRQAWYRRYARSTLCAQVAELGIRYGFPFTGRIYIREQATKWGNCSRLGNISLNWRLILVPPSVREYVLLHELLHTRIANHSASFWGRMRQLKPDYPEAIRLLGKYAFATKVNRTNEGIQ